MTTHAPSVVPGMCLCGGRHGPPATTISAARQGPEPELPPDSGLSSTAVARRTDPSTSWEAARSVDHIRASQQEVLALFRLWGPMTDELARARYVGRQSLSGFRTRRHELVAQGLLMDTGIRHVGETGRRMIVWGPRG